MEDKIDPITMAPIPEERLIKVKMGSIMQCFDVDSLYRFMCANNKVLFNPLDRQPFSPDIVAKVQAYGALISFSYTLVLDNINNFSCNLDGSVPGFVPIGDFIVQLIASVVAADNMTYTGLLWKRLLLNNKPVTMELTQEVSSILTLHGNIITFNEVTAEESAIHEQFLEQFQNYTESRLSGRYDDNYYVCHAVFDLLGNDFGTESSSEEEYTFSSIITAVRGVAGVIIEGYERARATNTSMDEAARDRARVAFHNTRIELELAAMVMDEETSDQGQGWEDYLDMGIVD